MAVIFGNMSGLLAYVFVALAIISLFLQCIINTVIGESSGTTPVDKKASDDLKRAAAWFGTLTMPLCILAVAMVINNAFSQ